MRLLTLDNIKEQIYLDNPVVYRYNFNASKWQTFELMREISVQLPHNVLKIDKGFKWDLASVPSWLWWLLKPFGRFDSAYLVHDKLYQDKGKVGAITYSRKECDQIMRDIALAMVDTKYMSLRRMDVWTRYYAVRAAGWYVWNKKD